MNATDVLKTMSPTMLWGLKEAAEGRGADLHGRELNSLAARDLITTDLTLTQLGHNVLAEHLKKGHRQ